MSLFGGGAANPYDEIVAKATDENLTSENWEIILTLCDKVDDEGQEGAHNAIAAVIKRMAHRNPNVQLYALSLAEALGKNLGVTLHREISSKAFTQALEKIVLDRTTHEKVRKRVLGLVAEWAAEFEKDTSLGIMEELYDTLKGKGYKFEQQSEPVPPTVDDEIRRKEEEELQRVLEMSMHDKGGRGQWNEYSLAGKPSSSAAEPSGGQSGYTASKYQGGYIPARTPSPSAQQRYPATPAETTSSTANTTTTGGGPSALSANLNIVTRVRALHTFEPSEPGELAFDKGDVIKVVDRGYKDWWRGQLKGRTGIFPVNYVEPMPEPTAAELTKEVEQEAAVFSQALNVEKLLSMLKGLDPDKDNLADNEEIQELYRSCMSLRPKIVKLIDKYSQKRADLVSMNETFVRARTIFDRMMEESLARHTGGTSFAFLSLDLS
ncbi:hypothetical protein FA15DRAFT_593066 [Coprinopsis marcescibilis]|uniref:Class E vacuolar protein-sorting machinery protein HSE1 n=1 Tax=Coprinopsis marcescibilis TaxID=230819 RepID=A0A5C3KU99_COPMA|nr:hypothetical protein FA15DRAFT_593066 [Coprinopsis marcescibilis]